MIISWLVSIGIILGVGDTLLGYKFGIGKKFMQVFNLLGPMMLSIAGIMALAPSFAALIAPIVLPVFHKLGMDPGAIGFIMGSDMGGYQLAMSLCDDETVGFMSGAVTAAMFGGTLFFTIPLGYSMISEREKPYFSKGLLIGLGTIPVGSVLAGLLLKLPLGTVLLNNIPILLLSILVSIGFVCIQQKMIAFMGRLAKIIEYVGLLGIGIGCFTHLTGISVIPEMLPILETMTIVCSVNITLLGMFPLVEIFMHVFAKELAGASEKAGINQTSCSGIICTIASSAPVYEMMRKMDPRGIVVNAAWIVCCAATCGGQLGLVLSVRPQYAGPFLTAKFGAGLCALALAFYMTRDLT